MLRILLADDHDIMRRGVRNLLESERGDWRVCGEARSGREAVQMAIEVQPDIAVLDLSMPELNGLEATRLIHKSLPSVEVLIYTMHDTDQLVHDVLASGARGYLLKSESAAHLPVAVDALAHHKPYLSPSVSQTVLASFLSGSLATGSADPVRGRLTAREREIVQLLADGKSTKSIATTLSISPKTVETHRGHIMHKLGVSTIVDLVRYAIRNEMVLP